MKIKSTTAFRALNARHAAERNDKYNFVVKNINKDGSVSKMPVDLSRDGFVTQEEAETRAAKLREMNPKSRFGVFPV